MQNRINKYRASRLTAIAMAVGLMCMGLHTAAFGQEASTPEQNGANQTVAIPESPNPAKARDVSNSTAIPPSTHINNHKGAFVTKGPQGSSTTPVTPLWDLLQGPGTGSASRNATNSGSITHGTLDTTGIIH